jgi:XrtJ-associated TM-motif-TM protein
MKTALRVLALGVICLSLETSLHAQNGCVTSPENPTAILAVLGTAGAFLSAAKRRISLRRISRNSRND